MRQFLLGAKLDIATALTSIANGQFAFAYLNNGVQTIDSTGGNIKDRGYIYLGKDNAKGGNVIIPIYKNNFSFSKMVYRAATAYSGEFTVPTPTVGEDLTVVVVKKGVKFNERNKYTATVKAKDSDTATTVAAALVKQINNNPWIGVTAANTAGKITITGQTAGEDFAVKLGDDLYGIAVTETAAVTALADAEYVKDLAIKAAADAGINDTYQDPATLIYPDYPLNPLKQADSTDVGFTVFTLKFSEPREMKTVDQTINQIVQLALPTDAAAIAKIEAILKVLAGLAEPATGA